MTWRLRVEKLGMEVMDTRPSRERAGRRGEQPVVREA
jgi:hypothetical protein